MKKLMVLVVLLAVALIAAPAIAQNEDESTTPEDTPVGGPPGDGSGAPFPNASEEPPPSADPAPAAPPSADPAPAAPPSADLVLETPAQKDEDPVSDTSADNTSPIPSAVTSTGPGSDVADGPDGRTRDDADDEITKNEIVNDDEVDAEAREDRIADRILADLKDGKKDDDEDDDKDDDDKDDDEDDDKDEVKQSQDQDADSGDVDQDADVINTGDNVNQCVGILQVANTGNAQNAAGITQFDSESDEIELEDGSQITLTPQLVVDCRQIILQIVRGERPNESKISKSKLRKAIQPRGSTQIVRTGNAGNVPNRVGGVQNRVGAGAVVPTSRLGAAATPKVLSTSRAGQPKSATLRSLPRTGGSATLLGLGTGILLVGGGLVVRRLAR